MTTPREEIGYVHSPARLRSAPSLPEGYEGIRLTTDGYEVTLRRENGRHAWIYAETEAEAMRDAKLYVSRGGLKR